MEKKASAFARYGLGLPRDGTKIDAKIFQVLFVIFS
jgi:hypothetical protein